VQTEKHGRDARATTSEFSFPDSFDVVTLFIQLKTKSADARGAVPRTL
jgi:hypothetical protein